MSIYVLPAVNASLNGLSALLLTAGFIFIRRNKIIAHRNCMISAFCVSVIFLVCYITYHSYLAVVLHRGPTRFLNPAWFRPIYLTILLTHTILAMVIVPLILITLSRALREKFDKHKKIARWTWPLWIFRDWCYRLFVALPNFPANTRMSATANITVHASQFPERVRSDLLESLRSRKIAHKFHYDSIKQTQKWLALHQQFSPSRTDENCAAIYEQSFAAAAKTIKSGKFHVIGLGCGGGQKDSRLIQALKRRTHEIFYTPCDVASAMVLTARQTALSVLDESRIFPFVCDLQSAANLTDVFNPIRGTRRVITFFGMIPNFEPSDILPKLASLVGPKDILLFSANMAPGDNYAAGMKFILPQYDNAPTRDWLLTFLTDLGIEKSDGTLHVEIEDARDNLKRISVYFRFKRTRKIQIEANSFAFSRGEAIRLFFSYRYTPARVRTLLSAHNLRVHDQWITGSGEEAVFLCTI